MKRWLMSILAVLLVFGIPAKDATAQNNDLLTMSVAAAYDGYFRDDNWMPIRIVVENNGDPVEGRLVVRPETSRGVQGTYSVPVNLPTNSRRAVSLYAVADAFTGTLRVELIDTDELVVANTEVTLRSILESDQLYVVVTQSASGSIDLTGAHPEGLTAYQANWNIDEIPDRSQALAGINAIIFTDVDTSALSPGQREALEAWVATGGRLIVTGGPNWQATAAAFDGLLPLAPDASENADDVTAVAALAGDFTTTLEETTIVATGALLDDAQVLAGTPGGVPLLARRTLGAGTVDYLALDPITEPLRSYDRASELWYTLVSSGEPLPSWSYGFVDWNRAAAAAEIIPGLNLLPSVLPICGFLALYIALIGPVNYVVLNAVNRREYAWLTIPALILLFSVLAYVVGGQLRGNDATMNRVSLVQSWSDTDHARAIELTGLLSPRRTQYTLTSGEDVTLRAAPQGEFLGTSGLLASNFQTRVEIQQSDVFRALDFPVDASFVARFGAFSAVEAPQISGTVSVSYLDEPVDGAMQVRGSVRNNTELPLVDGVILARGVAHRLSGSLEPGDVTTFDFELEGLGPAGPANVGYRQGLTNLDTNFGGFGRIDSTRQTTVDILGEEAFNDRFVQTTQQEVSSIELQELRRRQDFLLALMRDPYVSTGRGDNVYFAAWADDVPLPISLEDVSFQTNGTTLYITELAADYDQPAGPARVSGDRFTWTVHEQTGRGTIAPVNLTVQSGSDVAFRFTPVPTAQLDRVDELIVNLSHGGGRSIPVSLWNWIEERWDNQVVTDESLLLDEPDAYIGPQNAVIVRLSGDETAFLNVQSLRVEQVGVF